ncbi:hypothetical protein QR680_005125 [Steinernema hermaphroditum]|uniref:CTCK domain-containing protein n=1 Tax=Steinernema hermaphroditum TaxID=289476 RepID=A0AA39HQX8_9BILA|nr:hypothetical protein QR680_005125 [Steinernema hermaphroditum]
MVIGEFYQSYRFAASSTDAAITEKRRLASEWMEPPYNNHRRRISGDEGAGYQRRRPLLPPRLCSSSSSPSSSLNNRRSVFAVRTERQRLRPPTTIAPSPPSPLHHRAYLLLLPSSRRSSSPSDQHRNPLVASAPETTSAVSNDPFGPRAEEICRRAPCSSFDGDDKKATMRAESRVCRRWSLARPAPPEENSAPIPRCTANNKMTCQPAFSKPSASSATSSEDPPRPRIARIRERPLPDRDAFFLSLRRSLLFALLVLVLLAAQGSLARAQEDDSGPHEYRVDTPTDLQRNQTAFKNLPPGRETFGMLHGERVIEPLLDSRNGRREKWLQRHKNRKEKNERRGRKRLKGDQKENFLLTRQEMPKFENSCVGVKITQRVRMAGCLSRVVHNRYCHGSCTSVFIPRLRAKKLKATFESCSACLPSDYDRVEVKLECPNRKESPVIVRRVIKVKKCSCLSQCEIKRDT